MQEKDSIEEYYRKAFSDFQPEPPLGTWERIRFALHPVSEKKGGLSGFRSIVDHLIRSRQLYPVMASAAMVLLLMMIWFSYSHKHVISGHAYAGESRLCRGTAFLFKVYDKVKPYDTVKLIRAVPVDAKGFFQFSDIDHGNYLIRINPVAGSEEMRSFIPAFFNQDSAFTEANLVRVEKDDPTIDIRLIPR